MLRTLLEYLPQNALKTFLYDCFIATVFVYMIRVEFKVVDGKHAGQKILISKRKFLIGRDSDCQMRPASDQVSRHHCVVTVDDFSVRVRDLGSINGTFVNGERITREHVFVPGDELLVGPLRFRIEIEEVSEVHADTESIEASTLSEDEAFVTGDTVVGMPSKGVPQPTANQPMMPQPMYVPPGYPTLPGYPQPHVFPHLPMMPLPTCHFTLDYDAEIKQKFVDLHRKLRQSSIVKRSPDWIYQFMLEVGVTLLSNEPFQRVVILDARRMPDASNNDRIARFLKYVCRVLETVFEYPTCGRVFHPERVTQILRDIPASLFCLFHIEFLRDSDIETLRGFGFSQSKHRVLYCGENSYFTGRVFSGEIALPGRPAQEAPPSDSAAEIIRQYMQRRPQGEH